MERRGRSRSGRLRARCLLLACCSAVACAIPAPAAAEIRHASFKLKADKGFTAVFDLKQRRASLLATRHLGGRPASAAIWAAYIARGSIAGYRVRARFGGRGKINVRFEARRTVRRMPPPQCDGPPKVTSTGVFVGTIRFHGERGYTAVEAKRAPGKLRIVPRWKCGGAEASAENDPVLLEAKGNHLSFEAAVVRHQGEEGETRFIGGSFERRPRMRIFRGAWAFERGRAFVFDRGLTWATVAPPPPFAGSARFERGVGGPTWIGSLTVELPGAGTASFVGDGLSARLYRGNPEDAPGY